MAFTTHAKKFLLSKRGGPTVWLIAALLGFSGFFELVATRGPLGYVQNQAIAYLRVSETRAFEAFATARTIDAAVSVLKSVDFSMIVVQAEPMEALDPIDDLSKQFSDVMVLSLIVILAQQLILLIAHAWALTIALPIGCMLLALAGLLYRRAALSLHLAALGRNIVIIALFARFTIPIAGWVGNSITEKFLAGDLSANLQLMNASGGNLDRISKKIAYPPNQTTAPSPSSSDQGGAQQSTIAKWMQELQSAKTMIANGTAAVQAMIPDRAAIDAFLTRLPNQIVRVIAIFLVQTIMTPFLVAFLFYSVLRSIIRPIQPIQLVRIPPPLAPPQVIDTEPA